MTFSWRARWLLAIGALGLIGGTQFRFEPVALFGLILLIWIGLEWIAFQYRTLSADRGIAWSQRQVSGHVRDRTTISCKESLVVQLEAVFSSSSRGLSCWLEDIVPAGCTVEHGSPAEFCTPSPGSGARWSYRVRSEIVAKMRFPGVYVTWSDRYGLFRRRAFRPLPFDLTVLPFLIRPQTTVSVLKKNNVHQLMGTHRYRRPGLSTELLGIRDYVPGDPPRSIAWKPTARLGRLMTCEYESEVPVRANLIADLSLYQYEGRPGPSTADRVMVATASATRLLLSDGDPVGGLIISQSRRTRIPHGLGERQLTRMLLQLLSASRNTPDFGGLSLSELTQRCWRTLFVRHPDLFDARWNSPRGVPRFRAAKRRRVLQQRQQLQQVLAFLWNGGAADAARLQYDDREFAEACLAVLREFADDYSAKPLVLSPEDRLRSLRATTKAVCRSLMEGVAHANDNELFIVIGVFPTAEESLDTLEEAVRVARARYHRVMLVDAGMTLSRDAFYDLEAGEILSEARRQEVEQRVQNVERRFGKYDVRVSQYGEQSLIQQVAAEIDLLRSGRVRGGSLALRSR